MNVIKAPVTIGMGLLHLEHLPLIGALAPVVLACAWAGRRLAARIPQRVFAPSPSRRRCRCWRHRSYQRRLSPVSADSLMLRKQS
ncbi:hypothetical protein [Schaalia odontolytica]|uniref:hypothetical protein n=1 Tax=Schaalia odontolytica TaxID=1660 RepID=UPI00211CA377|nr:hypothetical protein [Schaalia odontolytica]UUO93680.1 hypothetical protein NQK35_00700 [Schaalia odontolytica]